MGICHPNKNIHYRILGNYINLTGQEMYIGWKFIQNKQNVQIRYTTIGRETVVMHCPHKDIHGKFYIISKNFIFINWEDGDCWMYCTEKIRGNQKEIANSYIKKIKVASIMLQNIHTKLANTNDENSLNDQNNKIKNNVDEGWSSCLKEKILVNDEQNTIKQHPKQVIDEGSRSNSAENEFHNDLHLSPEKKKSKSMKDLVDIKLANLTLNSTFEELQSRLDKVQNDRLLRKQFNFDPPYE